MQYKRTDTHPFRHAYIQRERAMTLPTNPNAASNGGSSDDDSDMFGPPRSSPPTSHHHHRSRVPMISPKLRLREERKRILQLTAHKLERIKDSEANLRRSVCINNTYSRLTDEMRREKQMRYLQNSPKTENSSENLFQPLMNDAKPMNNNSNTNNNNNSNSNNNNNNHQGARIICSIENHQLLRGNNNNNNSNSNSNSSSAVSSIVAARKRQLSNFNLVNDLEILDRELSAINAPMLLIDPEITQGAEQLEKASLSAARKRLRSNSCEDESDRLVREALSQFYIPPQRHISAIEDCPLDVSMDIGAGAGNMNGGDMHGSKRFKISNNNNSNSDHLELVDFDLNQNQKDFEVIMDALRLGTPGPTSNSSPDSCGQAAMMSESASVFHNLVVTSLET